MNPATEKTTANGKGQMGQAAATPVTSQEGPQAPSPEPQEPYTLEKKKDSSRGSWRAILIGTVVVVVLLIFALTQTPSTKPVASRTANGRPGIKTQLKTDSGYGSTTPINNAPNNSDQQSDGSKISLGTIANTRKSHPPTTPATNLGDVPAFGNPATWQPAPYPGTATTDIAAGETEDKNEHDALDKPSLVFVHNKSATPTQAKAQRESSEVDLGLGLPPGTRLRAHLESAVSTAVKTPVVAVIEYNYEHSGKMLIPAGSKVVGQLQSADRSGYIGVHFDTLLLPDGTSMSIDAAATDLRLRPLRGKVQGKNTGKNILVRSLAGVGEAMARLVGQGSLNQPLNEADLLRGRVVSNIGQASDQEVERLAITERIVVSLPASTEIYVVLEKPAKEPASTVTTQHHTVANSPTTEQLRQLLELQRELNQSATAASTNQ